MPDTLECPECGCDVRGCTETTSSDGRRRWAQPVTHAQTPTGARYLTGGLVHVEGGRRCLSDAKDRVVRT